MKFPVARDVFERAVKTFIQAALALAISDGLDWQDVLVLDNWKGWASAGLAAVASLVTSLISTQIGKTSTGQATSASLDPAVKLQPVDAPTLGGPVR